MESTGIVRRMDELGRVVIPKELRRTMRIREGEEVEVFATDDALVLKKFSAIDKMAVFRADYVSSIFRITGFTAIITDNDRVLAVSGDIKIARVNLPLTACAEELREARKTMVYSKGEIPDLFGISPSSVGGAVIAPIVPSGDVMGYVVLLSRNAPSELMIKTAEIATDFFASQV